MSRRSKGDRVAVFPVLTPDVLRHTRLAADRLGIALSEYIADVMAVAVGRVDLVQHADPSLLPAVKLTSPQPLEGASARVTTRLARLVAEEIYRHRAQSGLPTPVSAYVAHALSAATEAPLLGDTAGLEAPLTSARLLPVQEVLLAV